MACVVVLLAGVTNHREGEHHADVHHLRPFGLQRLQAHTVTHTIIAVSCEGMQQSYQPSNCSTKYGIQCTDWSWVVLFTHVPNPMQQILGLRLLATQQSNDTTGQPSQASTWMHRSQVGNIRPLWRSILRVKVWHGLGNPWKHHETHQKLWQGQGHPQSDVLLKLLYSVQKTLGPFSLIKQTSVILRYPTSKSKFESHNFKQTSSSFSPGTYKGTFHELCWHRAVRHG